MQKKKKEKKIESAYSSGICNGYGSSFFLILKITQKTLGEWFLFLLVICYCTPLLYKTAEPTTVMWIFTQTQCTITKTTQIVPVDSTRNAVSNWPMDQRSGTWLSGKCRKQNYADPPPAQVELAALFLVAKKKLSKEAKKRSILCKKTWGIQPWPF